MKTAGCAMGIIGLILCLASFGMFGTEIFRAMKAHQVTAIPMQVGETLHTQPIKVDTAKLCSISLRATVRSQHVQRNLKREMERYSLQYKFPFQYTVYDSAGKVLAAEKTRFAWDGASGSVTISTARAEITEKGGSADFEHGYQKFKVAGAPAQIRVEAQVDPDRHFDAEADGLSLVVYDNVTEHTRSVAGGCFLLVIGCAMGTAGLIVSIRSSQTAARPLKLAIRSALQSTQPSLLPLLAAAAARRLHETGRSGWLQLIGFVPVAGSSFSSSSLPRRGKKGQSLQTVTKLEILRRRRGSE